MFMIQKIAGFFITSASSLAALTIPLMTPLGDVLGISRQTSVLAYQLGNGFTNMLYPTSAALMASLGMARVHWWTQILYFILCLLAIIVAVWIRY